MASQETTVLLLTCCVTLCFALVSFGLVREGTISGQATAPEAPEPLSPCLDEDNDGYTSCEECDDGARLVNPGAPEVCGDFIDNDCDGRIC